MASLERRCLAQVGDGGLCACAVLARGAQDTDVRPNQPYRWRAEMRRNGPKPDSGFAQVVVSSDPSDRDERTAIRASVDDPWVYIMSY